LKACLLGVFADFCLEAIFYFECVGGFFFEGVGGFLFFFCCDFVYDPTSFLFFVAILIEKTNASSPQQELW